MAMEKSLILVANPGSASRKYALYRGSQLRASLHFEYSKGHVVCTLEHNSKHRQLTVNLSDINTAAELVGGLLQQNGVLQTSEYISHIGLRVVAPSNFFLKDHLVDDNVLSRLKTLAIRAPLHINATLDELRQLRQQFPKAQVVGVSDSAFHITKPEHAWNYGLPLEDADRLEIKRFGYHGLSAASVVETLRTTEKLPPKLIIAHLGSGTSITAVDNGKSIDTTMGYSPLEGTIMGTRCGSIDITAAQALKVALGYNDDQLDEYLNRRSGLLGLGGSADIRQLLQRQTDGDQRARLALQTYVYSVQKAIGQMTAALGGVDMLVFTGTVGERSAPIRERITAPLHYLDLALDKHANDECRAPTKPTKISQLGESKPICVIPSQEAAHIAQRVTALL